MDILPGFEKYVLKEFFNRKIQPLLNQIYLLERKEINFEKENLKLKYFFQGIVFFLKLKHFFSDSVALPDSENQWIITLEENKKIRVNSLSKKKIKDWEFLFSELFFVEFQDSTEVVLSPKIIE